MKMKMNSMALAVASVVLALAGCNRVDDDRTTSIPRGVDRANVENHIPAGLSAPPAPAERGPIAANANTMAPGTDAASALAKEPDLKAGGDAGVAGQEAAAKASDTASADAAKKQVESMMASSDTGMTARDTEANSPRHGTLTPQQESTESPKAGQVNNHSSTALEKDSGK